MVKGDESMTYGMDIIQGTITALQPLIHGGNEKTGSVSLLNRQKWIVDGEPMSIPFISGNAIRGQMRRRAFHDLLERLDYNLDLDSTPGRRLYHALFTGGVLEEIGKDRQAMSLKMKANVYDVIPEVRLFGFAWGNQMVESQLKVGQGLPVCLELANFLPNNQKPKTSFYQLISQNFHTRKDDLDRREDESITQMLVDYEVFLPGTVLFHEFRLEDPTDLDRSTLAYQIELWSRKPYLGGRSSTGHGQVKLDYDSKYDSKKYIEHYEENKKEAVKTLDELQKL